MTLFSRRLVVTSILACLFVVPGPLFAATGSAGVPMESIWFSKDPFFVGDEIMIFAPLYNSSPYRFRGSVTLKDNGGAIGTQEFSLLPNGGSIIIAFPWKATGGEHAFAVAVIDGAFFTDNKNFIDLPISEKTITEIKRFAEEKPLIMTPTADSLPIDGAQATKYLSTKIPASIVADTVPILGALEQFRVHQAVRAENSVADIASAITLKGTAATTSREETATTEKGGWKMIEGGIVKGDILRTPWGYVKLFFALCYQFVTMNAYAFYLLLSYFLYKIVRGIFGLFF